MMKLVVTFALFVILFVALSDARHHHKRRIDDESELVIPVEADHPQTSKAKPFFEHVDDQKEYVSYDEQGKPYMLCGTRNNGKQEAKRCYLPADKPTYDMGLACYSLWQGPHVVQDCWVNQMISLTQCQKRRCSAPDSPLGIRFCCCFGHECNIDYQSIA